MSTVQFQTKRADRRATLQRCERTQRKTVDAGAPPPAQFRLAQSLNGGAAVQRLAVLQRMLDGRAAAQREDMYDEEALAAQMKPVAQRQDTYDEEDLAAQMKPVAQREDVYDEEALTAQMKPVAQREDMYDEEDLAAQMKPAAQREDIYDEEDLAAQMKAVAQRQSMYDEDDLSAQMQPAQRAAGGAAAAAAAGPGGLPAPLQSGIQSLSGMDVSDVRVHRSSPKPAQIDALAYAQGNNIYLGAGQERHLPHEAWHVVQQRQGRVNATMQFNGTAINDSPGLEREADVMGGKAEHAGRGIVAAQAKTAANVTTRVAQGKIVFAGDAGVTGGLLQRKITYNSTTGEFETDGTRAKWRGYLKASTASEFGVPTSTNFDTLGMDRAHRIPYMAIETLVADYCNGTASDTELEDLTDSLFDTSTSEYTGMVNDRTDLEQAQGGTPSIVRAYANKLLSRLNSATLNVSPGNASENRGIQENADYGYQYTPGGTNVELTPRSDQVYNAWSAYGRDPSIPMTPGNVHIRSSQMSSLQYGGTKVDFSDVKW
jgi:Domain of unknown function (DUF4157)